jgi:hypothetical protein
VVFGVLASSQVLGFRVTRDSAETALARDLATKQMELIRAYGYGTYKGCPGTAVSQTGIPACSAQNQPTDKAGYTMSWSLTNRPQGIPVLSPPPLVGVNVTVSYRGKSYVLSSYLSCADGGDYSFTNANCPSESLIGN